MQKVVWESFEPKQIHWIFVKENIIVLECFYTKTSKLGLTPCSFSYYNILFIRLSTLIFSFICSALTPFYVG